MLLADRATLDDAERERSWKVLYELILQAARRERGRWEGDWTLETRALANEVVLKVFGRDHAPSFADRRHFYRTLALAARQVLVNRSEHRGAAKRGGGKEDRTLSPELVGAGRQVDGLTVIDLHRALSRFEDVDPRAAEVVELRFFLGLDAEEAATVLGISKATADRDWAAARAWLRRELAASDG